MNFSVSVPNILFSLKGLERNCEGEEELNILV